MFDAMVREDPSTLWLIPDHLITQEMCDETVHTEPFSFHYIYPPDRFKTQEMCNGAVPIYLYLLGRVPGHFKTQEMCNELMHVNPAAFFLISDPFKTQEMCIEGVEVDLW